MGEKYRVTKEGDDFIVEKELSPTEKAQKFWHDTSLLIIVLSFLGAIFIVIPLWVLGKIIGLAKRYPFVMVPLIIAGIGALIFMISSGITQENDQMKRVVS